MGTSRHLLLGAMGTGFLVVGLGLRWLGEGVGLLWLVQWALFAVGGFAAHRSERVRTVGAWVRNTRLVQVVALLLGLGVTAFLWFGVYLALTRPDAGPEAVVIVAFYGSLGTAGLWVTAATGRELLSAGTDCGD